MAIGQTHALLVGYLDLSVGAMVTFGVVLASFLIGPDASGLEIALGVGAIFLAALALGLINAVLVLGVKIPSIIATLATLSILNGISLTLRETPEGVINDQFTSWVGTGSGRSRSCSSSSWWARGARLLAPRERHRPADAIGRVRRALRQAERCAHDVGARARAGAVGPVRGPRVLLRHDAVGDRERRSATATRSRASRPPCSAAPRSPGGRATFLGAVVASVLLALILTVLPFLGLTGEYGLIVIGVLVVIGIALYQLSDIKELVKRNYKRGRRLVIEAGRPRPPRSPTCIPRASTSPCRRPDGR